MKKILLALSIGVVFAEPATALAESRIYGKFDVGLDHQKDQIGLSAINANALPTTRSTWSLHDQTNSSRLGVKGSDDLGLADLKGLYQVEFGINPDGNECNTVVTAVTPTGSGPVNSVKVDSSCQERVLTQRNIFVGLEGSYGALKLGKFDTPFKVAGEKVDQFNDEDVGDDQGLLVGETRQNNMIQYSSPKLADSLQLTVAVVPGEGRVGLDDAASQDRGIADTYYASLIYSTTWFYGAVAYAGHESGAMKFDKTTSTGTAGVNVVRLAATVNPMVDLELGGLYQRAWGIDQKGSTTNADGSKAGENSSLFMLGYSIEAAKLKAGYGHTRGEVTHAERTLTEFGVDYKLSKAFMAQLYDIHYADKGRTVNGVTNPQTSAYGMGVIYTF